MAGCQVGRGMYDEQPLPAPDQVVSVHPLERELHRVRAASQVVEIEGGAIFVGFRGLFPIDAGPAHRDRHDLRRG